MNILNNINNIDNKMKKYYGKVSVLELIGLIIFFTGLFVGICILLH